MQSEELRDTISAPGRFKEIWLDSENGSKLCALVAGEIGWLIYLRFDGDPGFSTRNPEQPSQSGIEFRLNNGQVDYYPESWTYPVTTLARAMESYLADGELPKEVDWHNDSVADVT